MSDSTKYAASKENTMMQIMGLSWKQCHSILSHNDTKYSIKELTNNLKMIINEVKSSIHSYQPLIKISKCRAMSIL